MDTKNIFLGMVKWNFRSISMLVFLILIPNFLGMINIPTPFGFNIHLFQIAVFIAALSYGPVAGLLSGLAGSVLPAVMMDNPYILVGNAILGFFVGYFWKKELNVFTAVSLAFLIQLPWLVLTDYYLVHLSPIFIKSVCIALLISNLVWAEIAVYFSNKLRGTIL